jgi:23S rRNA pseudouridine1911/1915/1917 synthase
VKFRAEGGERLDKFLSLNLPEFSRTRLTRLIDDGTVFVDGVPQKPSFKLSAGSLVTVSALPEESAPHDLTPVEMPLEILYEDDHLMVVNKPRGLATHPASTLREPSLVNALLARQHGLSEGSAPYRPGIVHRLDKETTGLLVIAKTDAAHLRLARQIAGKSADRRYLAVVAGDLEREAFRIEAPLARDRHNRIKMAVDPNGKPAVTNVKRLARIAEGTLIVCKLETGRTHQIRVHLQAVAHPVLGDKLYGRKANDDAPMQLHAAYLAFDHPVTSARIKLFAPPPEGFFGREMVTEASVAGAWSE